MAAFDRDAALERQQIHEIALNVARRLLKALDRSRFVPPAIAAEIEHGARIISGIQREIDQLMAALPPRDTLDIAVLTHVLGSQRHALGLLEEMESRLAGMGNLEGPPPDAGRIHAALLAASREIEQETFRHSTPAVAQPFPPNGFPPGSGMVPHTARPMPAAHTPNPMHRPALAPPRQQQPPSRVSAPRSPPKTQPKPRQPAAPGTPLLASARALLSHPTSAATLAALTVVAGLVVGVLSFIPSESDDRSRRQAAATLVPGKKIDGRLATSGPDLDASGARTPSLPGTSAEAAPLSPPPRDATNGIGAALALEQPYLVVLATRRSTDELGHAFRAFKEAHPELLGEARARVDRVQGQDKQTWYRLSLIPPQSRADAKALCGGLKAAGLTGCWIRPVPLGRSQ